MKFDRRQHVPMCFEECRPSGLTLSLGSRFNSVGLQDNANRGVGDVVSDVGQRTLDAVVAPSRVFPTESQDEIDEDEVAEGSSAGQSNPISSQSVLDASGGWCRV